MGRLMLAFASPVSNRDPHHPRGRIREGHGDRALVHGTRLWPKRVVDMAQDQIPTLHLAAHQQFRRYSQSCHSLDTTETARERIGWQAMKTRRQNVRRSGLHQMTERIPPNVTELAYVPGQFAAGRLDCKNLASRESETCHGKTRTQDFFGP
jgi:hypothetical protein